MHSLFNLKSRPVKGPVTHFPTRQGRAFPLLYGFLPGLLLALGGLASAGVASAQTRTDMPVSGRETASLGSNLLPSGDFAPGATGWKAELANGKASAALSWAEDAALPPGATGKVARFDVEAIDKDRWHVQFYHDGLDLSDNETYTLTFWARAGQERLLSVSVNADEDDYHPLGLDHQVTIGAQWRKVSLAFTASRVRKNHTRLCFMLGDALGRVELADARLQKGVLAPLPGPNLLRNANFAEGTTAWMPLHTEGTAQATLQVADNPPAGVGGKVAHISVTQAGSLWHVYFGQGGLSLEEGGVYTLSFLAKSKSGRSIMIHSDVEGGDYHPTGLRQFIALTPNWNKFTFVFTPTNTGNSAGRIVFSVGDAIGDVDLAGVVLQRGATPRIKTPAFSPEPSTARGNAADKISGGKTAANGAAGQGTTRAHRSHPLLGTWQSYHKEEGLTGKEYQRYRFVFEANGAGSLQVAAMSADPAAPPKSQQNETFKWDLIEGGPHVTIGANVYTWTIEKEGAKQKLTLKNYEGKTYILFRQ